MAITMGFDLQLGSLAARPAHLCQSSKSIHEFGFTTTCLISLRLQEMKGILRTSLSIGKSA
eukprot:1158060-Pelagomonas_calceolata.AAC.15